MNNKAQMNNKTQMNNKNGRSVLGPDVLMVTGGWGPDGPGKSVELLSVDGTNLCSLPDLPQKRYWHSQNGNLICGGGHSSVRKTCVTFSGGVWNKGRVLLKKVGNFPLKVLKGVLDVYNEGLGELASICSE